MFRANWGLAGVEGLQGVTNQPFGAGPLFIRPIMWGIGRANLSLARVSFRDNVSVIAIMIASVISSFSFASTAEVEEPQTYCIVFAAIFLR